MRKLTILTILTFLLISVCVGAESKQPPPKPSNAIREADTNKTEPEQTKTDKKQYGSKNPTPSVDDWVDVPAPLTLKQQNADSSKPEEEKNTQRTNNCSTFNCLLVIFNGLLAIFTFGLWCSTRKLWKVSQSQLDVLKTSTASAIRAADAAQKSAAVAEKTVETMADTTKKQLRAYVCIPGGTIKLTKKTDGMYAHVVLRYKNAGQTPGYDVRTWIALHIAEYPLNKILIQPPHDAKYPTIIISPGSEQFLVNEIVITPEQLPLFGTTKATLYVYGAILYRDIFGIERFTKYRLLYGGDEGTFGTQLRPDLEGNDAD